MKYYLAAPLKNLRYAQGDCVFSTCLKKIGYALCVST